MSESEQKYLIKIINPDNPDYGMYWRAPGEGVTRSSHNAGKFTSQEARDNIVIAYYLRQRRTRLVHVWGDRK